MIVASSLCQLVHLTQLICYLVSSTQVIRSLILISCQCLHVEVHAPTQAFIVYCNKGIAMHSPKPKLML